MQNKLLIRSQHQKIQDKLEILEDQLLKKIRGRL